MPIRFPSPAHCAATTVGAFSTRLVVAVSLVAASLVAASLVASPLAARPLERVPADGSLQQAIQRVSDRGVIEIADGTLIAPDGGFRIRNPGKSFTIRAAAGATVVLDGQGRTPIFTVEDRGARDGRTIAFEGLTFRDGTSSDRVRAGGLTIESAEVVVVSCVFEDNEYAADGRGGGAAQVSGESYVRFISSRFEGNTARQQGGGIFAFDGSEVDVVWSEFERNRVNLPGHGRLAVGGGIYLLDATLRVISSRFASNQAAWVGGAIYAIGTYQAPAARPSALVEVTNSLFVGNRANPNGPVPGPSGGGAIHVENQTTLRDVGSRYRDNRGTFGGAISSFRAITEFTDVVFEGNRAEPDGAVAGAGGALNVGSNDFPDLSTDGGTINRPSAHLELRNTRIRGRLPATPVTAQQGGCLFIAGDVNSEEGLGGVRRDPGPENRTTAILEEVIFEDCDVTSSAEGNALGGAMMLTFADLTLDDSLVFGSDATGENASGGAAFVFHDSILRSAGTAFAANSAEVRGGALQVNNSRIEIEDALFLDNDVTPGEAEPIQRSEAIVTLFPAATGSFDVSGFLRDSIFTDNAALPIFDIDRTDPPFSTVSFDGNEFHSPVLGELVYKNLASDAGVAGMDAEALNDLVIVRGDGSSTRKSDGGNRSLAATPEVGRLVAAPVNVRSRGAAGEAGSPDAAVGFAWNGPSARLAGTAVANADLAEKSGTATISRRGRADLEVDGERRGRAQIGEERCSGGGVMCLNQERFLVEMTWRDFAGNAGDAAVVSGGSDDSGLFFFFTEDNWEVLVKVLDGCAITDHFWVFAAATTNVEYTLRVTDTETGRTKSYFNGLGSAAVAITDTEALAACDAGQSRAPRRPTEVVAVTGETLAPTAKMECATSGTSMCLNRDRFLLEVEFRDFQNNSGIAQVVPLRSEDSGLFFFFTEDNWEMLVKVLDACGVNGHFWVFAAATTNVEYTLTVTDTESGERRRYRNPLGRAAAAVTDTGAFATCP